jgi:hypothetical protein
MMNFKLPHALDDMNARPFAFYIPANTHRVRILWEHHEGDPVDGEACLEYVEHEPETVGDKFVRRFSKRVMVKPAGKGAINTLEIETSRSQESGLALLYRCGEESEDTLVGAVWLHAVETNSVALAQVAGKVKWSVKIAGHKIEHGGSVKKKGRR